jgi:hypothetical protein
LIVRVIAPEKQATVNFWMQRLNPAAKHLRPAREFRNVAHLYVLLAEQLCCSARGENLDVERSQPFHELRDSGLIVNADQGPLDRHKPLSAYASKLTKTNCSAPPTNVTFWVDVFNRGGIVLEAIEFSLLGSRRS